MYVTIVKLVRQYLVQKEVQMNHLEQMCRDHFNEPMIVRHSKNAESSMGRITWCTCVGGYAFLDRLKDQDQVISTKGEHWNDFTRLDSVLALNGCPREESFMLDLCPDFSGP